MLTFKQLRKANLDRNESTFTCHEWGRDDWFIALGGEVGELENIFKKVRRGDFTLPTVLDDVANELADVVTYLDLLHAYHGAGRDLIGEGHINVLLTGDLYLYLYLYESSHTPLMRFHFEFAKLATYNEHDTGASLLSIAQCWDAAAGLAHSCDINLEQAIINKFNIVSDRIGSEVRL